jgi:hypothetical protein
VVRCTVGDVLIALASLVLTLLALNESDWPVRGYVETAALATALGLAYTLFSERINTAILLTWSSRN